MFACLALMAADVSPHDDAPAPPAAPADAKAGARADAKAGSRTGTDAKASANADANADAGPDMQADAGRRRGAGTAVPITAALVTTSAAVRARVTETVTMTAAASPHAQAHVDTQAQAAAAGAAARLQASAQALAQVASDFSPRYELVSDTVVLIDVSGLGRVIGPPDEVARQLERSAVASGLRLAVAIAPTRTAATLLALHGAAAMAERDRERERVASAVSSVGDRRARVRQDRLAGDRGGREQRATRGARRNQEATLFADMRTGEADERERADEGDGGRARRRTPAAARDSPEAGDSRRASIVVVPAGEEARALAALPIALLAKLPGEPQRMAAGDLPGLSREAQAPGKSAQASGGGGGRFSEQANAAYGKTRGRRSRGSGRNYRLAPSPGGAMPAEAFELLDTLHRWGLRTLGDVLRLPAAELFERFGAASFWLRQVASGQDARPLVPTLAAETFDAEITLDWPLDNLAPLAFIVSRLLDPLCARLERRDRGAVVVHVTLRLVTKTCEARRIELPAPMRDAKVLRTLILLNLESHPPGAGIDSLAIRFDVTPGRIVQHSLLTRALPSPEQLSTLIARLTAVMGEGRVGAPALIDSHRPDAFALRRFNPAPGLAVAETPQGTTGVLRRFRRPLPVEVRLENERPVHLGATRGVRGGPIIEAAGPWRSSGQWWQSADVAAAPAAATSAAAATPAPTAATVTSATTAAPAAVAVAAAVAAAAVAPEATSASATATLASAAAPALTKPALMAPALTASEGTTAVVTFPSTASAVPAASMAAGARSAAPSTAASSAVASSAVSSASAARGRAVERPGSEAGGDTGGTRDTRRTKDAKDATRTKDGKDPRDATTTAQRTTTVTNAMNVKGVKDVKNAKHAADTPPAAPAGGAAARVDASKMSKMSKMSKASEPSGARAGTARDEPDVRSTDRAEPPPAVFTRAWARDEWDIALSGGELCRIYFDHRRGRWMLESIVD